MRLWFRMFAVLSALLFAGASAASVKLAVLGDSLSDEYGEESYGAYAKNWVEQLADAGVDLGPTAAEAGQPGGSWGLPRRTLYQHNWARSGADTTTLLSGGQHTGVAGDVTSEGVTHAVLFIGANDFFPSGGAYIGIYFGTWSQAQIDSYLAQRVANINTALNALVPTGVPVLVATVPDYGLAPATQAFFTNAASRQAVADVIDDLNLQIHAIAEARQLGVIDINGAAEAIFGPHGSSNTTFEIGNVSIQLLQSDTTGGGNPTAGFVDDGVHPNTTLQGLIANVVMEGLNIVYGTGLTLFSEEEILSHRGIAYGGSDTVAAQLGSYTDYVTDYTAVEAVPAFSPGGLALLALTLVLTARRFGGMALRPERPTA